MDETIVLFHTVVDFHSIGEAFREAVKTLLGHASLMHLGIPLAPFVLVPPSRSGFALVKIELGASIKMALMDLLYFMVMPLAFKRAFTVSKVYFRRSYISRRWRRLRIVVSSGIRSLISSMPTKRRWAPRSGPLPSLDR